MVLKISGREVAHLLPAASGHLCAQLSFHRTFPPDHDLGITLLLYVLQGVPSVRGRKDGFTTQHMELRVAHWAVIGNREQYRMGFSHQQLHDLVKVTDSNPQDLTSLP